MVLTFKEELRDTNIPLDELLYKHGLNLKTALKKPPKNVAGVTRDSNIGKHKNRFQIQKYYDGKHHYYGRYDSLDDAILVKEKLEECNWDKTRLPDILEEAGIKRKIRDCTWYTLWNGSQVQYNKYKACKSFRVKYHGTTVNVGCFLEPVSCEVISDLIEDAVQ